MVLGWRRAPSTPGGFPRRREARKGLIRPFGQATDSKDLSERGGVTRQARKRATDGMWPRYGVPGPKRGDEQLQRQAGLSAE